MTAPGEPATALAAQDESAHGPGRRRDSAAVLEVCPFLAAGEGPWRSAYAAREHRCEAVAPPSALATAKQRQLCLLAAHETCATFTAARAVMVESARRGPSEDGVPLWPVAASMPLVLEPARRLGALPTTTARTGGQALLVALMAVAFLVLIIARMQAPVASGGATPPPSVAAGLAGGAVTASLPAGSGTDGPSRAPVASVDPASNEPANGIDGGPSASPTTAASPRARLTASPVVATRRYRVRAGDTLGTIAASYGTTVRALARLNDISDPRLITIGQVLKIP